MSFYYFLRKLIVPLDKIDYYLPRKGTIIDLGCGQGIICKFIANSHDRKIIGVDVNTKRLPKIKINNLKFISADITKYKIKKAEGVVLSDVLHHLPLNDQKKIIKKVYSSLAKDGILIIKEIDSDQKIRSKLSRLWDLILYPKDKISYWKANDLIRFLSLCGFRVTMRRESKLFPGSTNLFVASK